MTSINSFYTINYVQPDEYRFSHDSVFLAREVFENLKNENQKRNHILDLCSGCGVVGIDYLFHLRELNSVDRFPDRIDFLEQQVIYQNYFQTNMKQLGLNIEHRFLQMNYADVFNHSELHQKYDLILCNPPYFRTDQGLLSPSDFKNRCRFFMDSDFKTLIQAIEYLLADNGKAYVLIKNLENHGIFVETEMNQIAAHLQIEKVKKIRQTDLYLMTKKNLY